MCARHKVAFDQYPDDAFLSVFNLFHNITTHRRLLCVVFVAVGMAAINHDRGGQFRLFQLCTDLINRIGRVVGSLSPTSEDDVAVRIARRDEDR